MGWWKSTDPQRSTPEKGNPVKQSLESVSPGKNQYIHMAIYMKHEQACVEGPYGDCFQFKICDSEEFYRK